MYQCMNCGNVEKFIGCAQEKGNAYIYQDSLLNSQNFKYSWIYIVSDNNWQTKFNILKCFFCHSTDISKL
jgi:hypothetical protein